MDLKNVPKKNIEFWFKRNMLWDVNKADKAAVRDAAAALLFSSKNAHNRQRHEECLESLYASREVPAR